MTVTDQIKVLCVRCNVSKAELSRRLGKSPQSFNAKLKRGTFTVDDLQKIADVLGAVYSGKFKLENGDEV